MRWVLILCLLLVSCATDPPPRSHQPPAPAESQAPSTSRADLAAQPLVGGAEVEPGTLAHVQVVALALPQQASLWELWSRGAAPGDEAALARWHDNGLDAVVLSTAPSASNLPTPLGRRGWGIATGSQAGVLDVAPLYRTTTTIAYRPEHERTEVVRLGPGRPQFLIRARTQDGKLVVSLTPHHHHRQPTVRVRSVEDRTLEGTVFESLTLEVALEPGQVLAVGLRQATTLVPPPPPVPAPAPSGDAAAAQPPTTQPAAPASPEPATPTAAPETPAVPTPAERDQIMADPRQAVTDLGSLLLQANRLGQPTQTLVLMTARLRQPATSERK